MSLKFGQTPFTRRERARRFELFDSISTWTLVMAIVVEILYALLTIFQYSFQFLLLALCTLVMIGACVVARVMARRGYLEPAIYLLIGVLLLVMSLSALTLEGIVLIAATFYVAVIVLASVLLGSRASFTVAGLAAVLYLTVSILSRQPFIVPLALSEEWSVVLISFISALTFLFVAHLGRLTTRDLRRALNDATYDLVKANEELQEANRVKTRFLARVSHELRTPLNAIIGYTDMNLAGFYGELNDAQRDALERVQRNSHQLLCLINDVLDLSRIEVEGLELQEFVFSPEDLVHSVIATVEPRAHERGLALGYHVAPELPPALVGDQVRLNQVLLNLVDNAIKFTTHGGVHIDAQPGQADTWTLQVRDTGRGISERELPHIFEEFRQGERDYNQESEGVGLGLAIAHRLVEAMGGTISVHSRLGVGSTFTVTLPMSLAPQTGEHETRNTKHETRNT
jgi:signal transduction histidine kinase